MISHGENTYRNFVDIKMEPMIGLVGKAAIVGFVINNVIGKLNDIVAVSNKVTVWCSYNKYADTKFPVNVTRYYLPGILK